MIGITGGIGSGKSSVAARLCKETGFNFVSADRIASEMLGTPGKPLYLLRDLVGSGYFFEDGTLDRTKFRQAIFSSQSLREQVNKLLHPMIHAVIMERVMNTKESGGGPVIAEIPLLYEAGWVEDFSVIVVVYAPCSVGIKRLMSRDGIGLEAALLALSAQEPLEEKALRADHVIDNGGSWGDTLLQIKRLGGILLAKSP